APRLRGRERPAGGAPPAGGEDVELGAVPAARRDHLQRGLRPLDYFHVDGRRLAGEQVRPDPSPVELALLELYLGVEEALALVELAHCRERFLGCVAGSDSPADR